MEEKEVIQNSITNQEEPLPETSFDDPVIDDLPVDTAKDNETSDLKATENDTTEVLQDSDKPASPDETTISNAYTKPPENIVESSTEESQAEKRTGGGFLKNLQSNIGGLFKSGNQDESEKSDSKDI